MSVDTEVAAITRANSEIGQATARPLAEDGMDVASGDFDGNAAMVTSTAPEVDGGRDI